MKVNKILISQPQPATAKSPYFDIAAKYGVEFVFKPLIRVEALSAKEFRQQKVSILDHTAIVFTSRHAVDHFFNLCTELRITIPDDMKYFCITEQVSLYIQKYVQYRKRKVFFGTTGSVDSLMAPILKHKTESYFIPMSTVHTDELKKLLDAAGIKHTEAVMYRTVSNEISPEEINAYDMLVFFSPAGIDSLKENVPDFVQGDRLIGCLGAKTAQAIRDAGFRLDIEAPAPGVTSISAAIENYLAAHKK
ncbi:MAG: uroporphyrinogen-III synthase [Bacteroidaceae bacterium]|nr:uroporphyrinogen-III synthase [Bacteroidaceae bacterium]